MDKDKRPRLLIPVFIVIGCGLISGLLGLKRIKPQERSFNIEARQYAYKPEVIRVNKGDKVTLKLTSKDVTHGFYLEGYDIEAKIRAQYPYFWFRRPSENKDYEQVDQLSFIAQKPGKFRYRCSTTCGTFHPFMQGELIVNPNFVYPLSIGCVLGLAIGMMVYLRIKE